MRRKTDDLPVEDSDRYNIFIAIGCVCRDNNINERHFAESIGWSYPQYNKVKRGEMVLTKGRREELIGGIRRWNEGRDHILIQLLIDMGVITKAGQLSFLILASIMFMLKFII